MQHQIRNVRYTSTKVVDVLKGVEREEQEKNIFPGVVINKHQAHINSILITATIFSPTTSLGKALFRNQKIPYHKKIIKIKF